MRREQKESPRLTSGARTDETSRGRTLDTPILSGGPNQARRGSPPSPVAGITGRFVLLPKNVVTGAAKVDIMSRSTHTGRCFLWKATLQAPA